MKCSDVYLCFRTSNSIYPYVLVTTDYTIEHDYDGVDAAYKFFAEKAYELLVNGRSLYISGKEVKAEDVPAFMISYVLSGMTQKSEQESRDLI